MQTVRNVSHVFCCFFFASVADKDSQRRIATGAVSCMTANYCTPRESSTEMCTQYTRIILWIIHHKFSPARWIQLQWRYWEYRRFMNNTFRKFGGSLNLRIIKEKTKLKKVAGKRVASYCRGEQCWHTTCYVNICWEIHRVYFFQITNKICKNMLRFL